MNRVLPAAIFADYHRHISTITLPDPDDRHVVAAAIEARALVITTWNVRDFPSREQERHGLISKTPDGFLMGLHAVLPDTTVAASADRARRNLRRSELLPIEFVRALKRQQLHRFAKVLMAALC
jgi:hypothetical protein